MEPIAPLTSSPILGSSTSGAGGHQQNPQQMLEGQTIQALVIEAANDDTFILEVGTRRFLAQGDSVTLSPGQSLQLQVTATTPQLELKVITAPLQQYLGPALTSIGQNLDVSPLLQVLSQPPNPVLASLTPASRQILEDFFTLQQKPVEGKEGGETLRRMVNTLGLHTEATLAARQDPREAVSLKTAILEALHLFNDSEKITEAGKSLLATIEGFQLSQLRLDQDRTMIIPLPFPFLDQGYLLIDQKQGQEKEELAKSSQLHFFLHLSLTGLGNIQIEFLQTVNGIWMRFNCASQEKADFVGQFSDDLKSQLTDIPLQGLSFSATANDPGTDLVRLMVPAGQSLLNTKV